MDTDIYGMIGFIVLVLMVVSSRMRAQGGRPQGKSARGSGKKAGGPNMEQLLRENARLRALIAEIRQPPPHAESPWSPLEGEVSQTPRSMRREALCTLGLDPEVAHTQEDIRQAYIRRAKSAHPDVGGSGVEMMLIRTAYDRLRGG